MARLPWRRVLVLAAASCVVLVALVLGAVLAVSHIDLAGRAAAQVSRSLGRNVSIQALQLRAGPGITLELRGLVLDNVAGTDEPRAARIDKIDAEISPWSLVGWMFGWPPVVRHVSIEGLRLVLEHGPDDRPNWRFGTSSPKSATNPRAGFPILLDVQMHRGEIDIRTSSGAMLRVALETASVAAAGADQPILVSAEGAYNATPVRVAAKLQSFDVLHDAARPFGTDVELTSGSTKLHFNGTMTDPINLDGCEGRLDLAVDNWDTLLAIAGAGGEAKLPVVLAGAVTHQGENWRLTEATGSFRGAPMTLSLNLDEGARRAPDSFTLDADFAALDLTGVQQPATGGATAMHIDAEPGTILAAHVAARQFVIGAFRAPDLDVKARLSPGALVVDQLALGLAGGTARLEAAVKNADAGITAQLDASVTKADIGQLSRLLGSGAPPLSGNVDARLNGRLTGADQAGMLRSNSGALVLSMRGGSIARNLVAQISTDVRLLFRKAEGSARIDCLLGVLDVRDGIGRLAPLRLRTSDGTIAAAGSINLARETLDVTVATESSSTSAFALDVPVRASGSLRSPDVRPALRGQRPAQVAADLRAMSQDLQSFARGNPCFSR